MTKHSPGPWIREGIQAGCHRLSTAAGRVIAYFGIQGIEHGTWFVDEVDRANADLAVRAPELLDTIKRLLPYAESRMEDLMDSVDHSPEGDANTKKAIQAVQDAQALILAIDPAWKPGDLPAEVCSRCERTLEAGEQIYACARCDALVCTACSENALATNDVLCRDCAGKDDDR